MRNKLLQASFAAMLLGNMASAQNLSGRILFSLQNAFYDSDSICTVQPDGTGFQYITNGSYPRLSKDVSIWRSCME